MLHKLTARKLNYRKAMLARPPVLTITYKLTFTSKKNTAPIMSRTISGLCYGWLVLLLASHLVWYLYISISIKKRCCFCLTSRLKEVKQTKNCCHNVITMILMIGLDKLYQWIETTNFGIFAHLNCLRLSKLAEENFLSRWGPGITLPSFF